MAKFYRLNENIQAPNLRVIDPEGKQLGVITRLEALEKAKELELDLIEIAAQADPPVARIFDFQKFRYEESKKDRGAKKGGEGGLKELWLSPRIEEHDLKVRLDHTRKFLEEGYKVKLTVKFKGREMAHPELGHRVLQEVMELLGDKAAVEGEPKFEGRRLSMTVTKIKGGKKNEQDENQEINTKEVKNNIKG
ncbi:TPA: translation initiation factor IF-3 [Candidatus Daviesbacteria bacterium]|nr:translation initiation factor IF-3 [Candidatus Daviesbacteria bacterium]HCB23153.1 translation initiation factor IF-3 [Candidatus Daviesbacteria bacterium]